jgi:glycosyltransferase involved in cell wall biosynthesis
VIASRTPGLDEAVLDGITGVLVPIDDVDALVDAIETLLAHPPRISGMGRAARQRAASEHSFERCVAEHEDLYQRLVSR